MSRPWSCCSYNGETAFCEAFDSYLFECAECPAYESRHITEEPEPHGDETFCAECIDLYPEDVS